MSVTAGRHRRRYRTKPRWVILLDWLDLQIPTSPWKYAAAALFGLLFTEAIALLASIVNQP